MVFIPLKNTSLIATVTFAVLYNNYSMSPSWIRSDKITNERVARVGYNHFLNSLLRSERSERAAT